MITPRLTGLAPVPGWTTAATRKRGAKPYGIAITPDGTVWYAETGVQPNTLVRFDPKTRQFSKTDIPSGGGVVRNMAATPDGKVYLACSGVNKVAIAEVVR